MRDANVRNDLKIQSFNWADKSVGDCFQRLQETVHSLEGNGFKYGLKEERRQKQSDSSLIEGKDLLAVSDRLWKASRVGYERSRG